LVNGQRRYTRYRAEKDPARGMLSRFHGAEWTESYIHEVLFDLDKHYPE
jgi:phycoerythrobilin:ferredoxin oxidoreductase